MENSLGFALAANETLAKRLTEVEARVQQAEKDFRLCLRRVSELEQELDQTRQRDLQNCLIFSGHAISSRMSRSDTSEGALRLLRTLLQQFMGYNMSMEQVADVRREGRQICVRFTAVGAGSDRYQLVLNKTKLRGSGLYIREKLTPMRLNIFNRLMQMKRDDMVSAVFTRDGTVFVAVGQQDRPRAVRGDAALERLCRELAEAGVFNRAGPPEHGSSRPGRETEAARRGRDSATWDSPARDPGGGATQTATRSTSSLGQSAEVAGRSIERERNWSGADPSVDGGVGAADTALARRAPVPAAGHRTTTADGTGSGSGSSSGEAVRVLDASGSGDGGDGEGGDGGGGRAGSAGEGGGRGRVQSATVPTPAADAAPPPAHEQAGVRRRFRGDMRQFVSVHSKRD